MSDWDLFAGDDDQQMNPFVDIWPKYPWRSSAETVEADFTWHEAVRRWLPHQPSFGAPDWTQVREVLLVAPFSFTPDFIDQLSSADVVTYLKSKDRCEEPGSTLEDETNEISDRGRLVLQAMHEMRAFCHDSRATTRTIASKAEGPSARPDQFKPLISDLTKRSLLDTKPGREGGCWLTKKGRRLAQFIASRSAS